MKAHNFLKNLSYSFSANVVSLGVSVFMVMFLPKFLSLEDYGLWQLFLFYFSYLGFLHFGWEDGIYLRYAGNDFSGLNSVVFAGQFYGIVLLQIVLVGLGVSIGNYFIDDIFKKWAFVCALCLAPVVNFNNLCNFIMQITNRIRDYAMLIFVERFMLLAGVSVFLFVGINQFTYLYGAKVFSVWGVSLLGAYLCRQLLRPRFGAFCEILHEAWENISVGIKLMFANVASMLIIGVIRYGISVGWDVTTFGRISLTLGISNFLMIFINSVSVVFFPVIKQMDINQRAEAYVKIREILTIILFTGLLAYYPLKCILSWWLPKYADSLIYMSVLFPVCLFESKVSLLINTYLKSMRQEFLMLKINVISVGVSVLVTICTVCVLHDLNVAVLSIAALYAFRCILAECHIARLLNISLKRDIFIDLIMAGAFVSSGWLLDSWVGVLAYACFYGLYLIINFNKIRSLCSIIHD